MTLAYLHDACCDKDSGFSHDRIASRAACLLPDDACIPHSIIIIQTSETSSCASVWELTARLEPGARVPLIWTTIQKWAGAGTGSKCLDVQSLPSLGAVVVGTAGPARAPARCSVTAALTDLVPHVYTQARVLHATGRSCSYSDRWSRRWYIISVCPVYINVLRSYFG